jgi:hypothetical protein
MMRLRKVFGRKAAKSLTEQEILRVFDTLWYPGPCSPDWPFDVNACPVEARENYFEQVVQPDLQGNLRLLLDMLFRQEEFSSYGNIEDFKSHISDYLSAIHRLTPEEFYVQIEPYFDNPKMRPTLLWSAICSDSPSFQWVEPWIERLHLLTEEELLILIDEIGAKRKKEVLQLLQRIRSEAAPERTSVHQKLDLYLNHPEQFIE